MNKDIFLNFFAFFSSFNAFLLCFRLLLTVFNKIWLVFLLDCPLFVYIFLSKMMLTMMMGHPSAQRIWEMLQRWNWASVLLLWEIFLYSSFCWFWQFSVDFDNFHSQNFFFCSFILRWHECTCSRNRYRRTRITVLRLYDSHNWGMNVHWTSVIPIFFNQYFVFHFW